MEIGLENCSRCISSTNYQGISVILKKSEKPDNSQTSSAVIMSVCFLYEFYANFGTFSGVMGALSSTNFQHLLTV